MSNFKLGDIQGGTSGLDSFFQSTPQIVTPTPAMGQAKAAAVKPPRVKVGSLTQLEGFQRLSAETLVHRSTQDLWALKREGNDFYIERLFSDGDPLKG